jgi:hypothetical protein
MIPQQMPMRLRRFKVHGDAMLRHNRICIGLPCACAHSTNDAAKRAARAGQRVWPLDAKNSRPESVVETVEASQ